MPITCTGMQVINKMQNMISFLKKEVVQKCQPLETLNSLRHRSTWLISQQALQHHQAVWSSPVYLLYEPES